MILIEAINQWTENEAPIVSLLLVNFGVEKEPCICHGLSSAGFFVVVLGIGFLIRIKF